MREDDGHASGGRRHRLDHVLHPGVVAVLGRWHAGKVPAVRIAGPNLAPPLFEREGRIGDDAIKASSEPHPSHFPISPYIGHNTPLARSCTVNREDHESHTASEEKLSREKGRRRCPYHRAYLGAISSRRFHARLVHSGD